LGAYGVHLGQEDLNDADVHKIHAAGLRLGISTHCYYEVARAHAYHPSYIAIGPVFKTDSKIMSFPPQGLDRLHYWRRLLPNYPLVAIGGINEMNMQDVLATGVDGVAMISAITKAKDVSWIENLDCDLCANYSIISNEHKEKSWRAPSMREYVITVSELNELLKQNAKLQLVDVRTIEKHISYNIGGKHIPIAELPERMNELDPDSLVVTYCTSGGNSMRALQFLLSAGFHSVKSLDGGMTAWQVEVTPHT
jgi:rhodanese-related sulfurtransferase